MRPFWLTQDVPDKGRKEGSRDGKEDRETEKDLVETESKEGRSTC